MSSSAPLLHLRRATVIRDTVPVLHAVDLRIEAGQHTAILGPNGCGKSTLVKLIDRELYAVLETLDATPVEIFGAARWNVSVLRRRLGIVSADLGADLAALAHLDVEDTVVSGFFSSFGLPMDTVPTPAQWQAAHRALDDMGVRDLARRRLSTLSAGQARRVLIARALVHGPEALLLDEPSTGLDITARWHLLDRLRTLAQGGTTLILVTHHLEELIPEIGHVVLMRGGRVLAEGVPDEVLTDARMSELFERPLRVLRHADSYSLLPA